MAVTHSPDLVEREGELDRLRDLLAGARAGRGAVAVVEGPAGQGKTALLRAFRAEAAGAARVLAATGAEFERDFAFGLVRQLLEPELHGAGAERRDRLLTGAARLAEPVFAAAAGMPAAADLTHARLHGLCWLAANLAEEEPLVLVVDDVHWGDAPSLRFLEMLARRLDDLPLLLVAGARPSEPCAEQRLLDALAGAPAAEVVRLRPLSPEAVGTLVRRELAADAAPAFVAACAQTTAGNPLFVRELLRALRADGVAGRADEAEQVRRTAPRTVARTVVGRLQQVSPDVLAYAQALAVLGDRSTASRVATLARLGREAADRARALLVRLDVVEPHALAFLHPVVRAAVLADLDGGRRADWHRRAARLLAGEDAPASEVAVHLLQTEPEGDAWAAQALSAAGARALAGGAPDVAVRLLRRALAEPPAPEDRDRTALQAGLAAARAGLPDALEGLTVSRPAAAPELVAEAARARAQLLLVHDRAMEAAGELRRAIGALADCAPALAADLEDELLDMLPNDERLLGEYGERLRRAARAGNRRALAHMSYNRASAGAPAAEVVELALRAFGGGELIRASRSEHYATIYVIEALHVSEAAQEAAAILHEAGLASGRSGSRLAAGALTWMECQWERLFGDLRRAEDHARRGMELMRAAGAGGGTVMSTLSLVSVLLDRGEVEQAAAAMAGLGATRPATALLGFHATLGRLRLAQGRAGDALPELERQLEAERRRGWVVSSREDTRGLQAAALAALGRPEEAARVLEAELAVAGRRGVAGARARALLAQASLLEGGERLAALQHAVEAGRRSPSTAVRARALAELGSALRRAGRRVESREPLREARELAHRCGLDALERWAHEELVVAGARPQRVALSGLEALTAAERRVADLAAAGLRNREIAETLFVTQKTVEVHLGHAYAKLGIHQRSQLPGALARR